MFPVNDFDADGAYSHNGNNWWEEKCFYCQNWSDVAAIQTFLHTVQGNEKFCTLKVKFLDTLYWKYCLNWLLDNCSKFVLI